MNRITKLAALVGTVATLSFGAVALAGPGGHHGAPEGAILHAIKELDLSTEQVEMLKAIREANRDEHEANRAQREKTMEVFKAELQSDSPDAAKLHALIDAREADMVQRAHDRLDTLLEIHAVLTPEQRAQIATKLEEMRERHDGMRERRGGDKERRRR